MHLPDAQAMREFVSGLSVGSRRNRFHGSVSSVSPALLQMLISADGEAHAAWIACIWGEHGEEIVGEAVWVLTDPQRRSAELAISVRDDWHGTGVADSLMLTLLQAARDMSICELYGDVLKGNARMLAFMRRHGMEPGIFDPPEDGGLVRVGCQFQRAATLPDESWWTRFSSRWL
ncbi:MAG: GNAT family N-acetyltransferase [Variovorax sp.]